MLGDLGELLRPRPAADLIIDELGQLRIPAGQGRDDGRARRGHELRFDPGRIDRDVPEELGHGRRGTARRPWEVLTQPEPTLRGEQ